MAHVAARLAIIGAGSAGLAAARSLKSRRPELDIVVFEKSKGLGGRAATRRRDAFAFDHGAQVIKAPNAAVERFLKEELPSADLRRMSSPVWVFNAAGAISPGDSRENSEISYFYQDGNNRLGKLLAEGQKIEVVREVRVGSVRQRSDGGGKRWTLLDTAGKALTDADAVLFTAPGPQCEEILAKSEMEAPLRDKLRALLGQSTYRMCVSVALAYDRPVERPFYALLNNDRQHPISWLALEHAKGAARCPAGKSLLVAQMSPEWSKTHFDKPAEWAITEAAAMVSKLLGEDLTHPLFGDKQGWRFALPSSKCDREALNGSASGLFFAGDFVAGQGRVHLAIESGWDAATRIDRFLSPASSM